MCTQSHGPISTSLQPYLICISPPTPPLRRVPPGGERERGRGEISRWDAESAAIAMQYSRRSMRPHKSPAATPPPSPQQFNTKERVNSKVSRLLGTYVKFLQCVFFLVSKLHFLHGL